MALMRRTLLFLSLSLATRAVLAEYEVTYRSSPLAILPLTILERSADYDPDNTTLFLASHHRTARPNHLRLARQPRLASAHAGILTTRRTTGRTTSASGIPGRDS
ncbi:hypothetical protein R3P38DRAFT_3605853 [Favolaschia claudopus]|uniref:Uncharacterized protein n=1 Tax=Favolaschia claudopus TaxID=2862362 RepID=A0AAW0DE55_9AGAR